MPCGPPGAWSRSLAALPGLTCPGGEWALANRGVAADSVGGFARAGLPAHWCAQYGRPRQQTFAFRRYGHAAAKAMAREFIRRATFFFLMWVHAEDPEHFVFDAESVVAYAPPAAWVDFLAALQEDAQWARRRALQVARLHPRIGPPP